MDIHNKNVRVGDKRKPDEKLRALCQTKVCRFVSEGGCLGEMN